MPISNTEDKGSTMDLKKTVVENKTFDEERSLYHLQDAVVRDCVFAGPADGESVLKEARDVEVENCSFSLRYPLWHVQNFTVAGSQMDEKTRAAIWYARGGMLKDCQIDGIKCLRECDDIQIEDCKVHSPEFGWRCRNVKIKDSEMEAEYFLFECRDVEIDNLQMKGKYSFQYIENMQIKNSVLDTKDAFWHSKNVTVTDSVVKGEYLAWYSENLTLINCKIIGTQPLCYCKGLKLINCTMEETDLSFEYSEVEADVAGHIMSVKNPKSGRICADSIGEIVREDSIMEDTAEIIERTRQ